MLNRIFIIFFASIFSLQSCSDDNSTDINQSQQVGSDSWLNVYLQDVEYIIEPQLGPNDSTSLNNFINSNVWTLVEGSDNSTRRFILLEKYTAHRCSGCPFGAREISRLKNIFGEQLIPVGLHTEDLAAPSPSGSLAYSTDFRVGGNNDEAATYANLFNVLGYPSGVISRIGTAESQTDWEASIRSILTDAPKAKLDITNYYDSTKHVVRSQVDIEWLDSLTEDYSLQLYAIEGKIIDWQIDHSFDNPNYEHNYVLRKIVNGTFGKALKPANQGNEEKIQYIFSLDDKWVGKNIEIVAFIFNNDRSVNEVIQVNSAFLK